MIIRDFYHDYGRLFKNLTLFVRVVQQCKYFVGHGALCGPFAVAELFIM